ncbi:MAG: TIGR01459 family HAD-type hydrolase [Rhizobiales bacterium]|nr:TIGR01459 family HAD-type hydrolase [Hyphomicrobiales bacterium]
MRELSERYPVWFCDIWGVVHNGIATFPSAIEALIKHRRNGGTVILVSNSPRTSAGVDQQLAGIGVDPASHDAVVTSGDVTRTLVETHGGGKVFHLGPSRDQSIFHGLAVARTELSEAHTVLCTGLFDDAHETPGDYAPLLKEMLARELSMICANPDKTVRKGNRILYCAGSLADAYAAMGGKVLMAGKPYRPIYDLAMQEASRIRGGAIQVDQVLAIGDGPETDIRGAAAYGIDAVLVAEGISDGLDRLEQDVKRAVPDARIVTTMRQLAWPD